MWFFRQVFWSRLLVSIFCSLSGQVFLGTTRTGELYGERDGWIIPLSNISFTCVCIFFLCTWGNQYCLVLIGLSSVVGISSFDSIVWPRRSPGRQNRCWYSETSWSTWSLSVSLRWSNCKRAQSASSLDWSPNCIECTSAQLLCWELGAQLQMELSRISRELFW